ncbi:MAG: hypothetical protein AABX95_04635 [Nanoarchaeota archaeon]
MKKTKKLQKICELGLEAVPPFNFKYTVYKPSHFPTKLEDFDEVSESMYRTFRLSQDKLVGLKMVDLQKARGKDGIMTEIFSNRTLTEQDLQRIRSHINHAYGLNEDVKSFYKAVADDLSIQGPIKNLRGMRVSCFENLFEILNISSMLQNTTVKRSEQMMENMLSTFGRKVVYDGRQLYVFYTPQDIVASSEQKLRDLKVGYRAKFIMDIAKHFSTNIDLADRLKTKDFDEAKEELMEIRGVGPYSARIALFQYLRRPNEINFDSWKRKIFSKLFFGNDDKPVEKVEKEAKQRWGDLMGYAGLYIIEDLFVRNPEMQYWRKKK